MDGFITLQELRDLRWEREDVHRICPFAPEYGRANAPYLHRNDLDALLGPAREEAPKP
jgi:hypothetical protein